MKLFLDAIAGPAFYFGLAFFIWHLIAWFRDLARERRWREGNERFMNDVIEKNDTQGEKLE